MFIRFNKRGDWDIADMIAIFLTAFMLILFWLVFVGPFQKFLAGEERINSYYISENDFVFDFFDVEVDLNKERIKIVDLIWLWGNDKKYESELRNITKEIIEMWDNEYFDSINGRGVKKGYSVEFFDGSERLIVESENFDLIYCENYCKDFHLVKVPTFDKDIEVTIKSSVKKVV